jgi:MEMO1 family protein
MKLVLLVILAFSVLGGLLLMRGGSIGGGEAQKIREPAVAGLFYPADAKELAKMVDDYLARAAPPPAHSVLAIVAPHAGYIYSGPVAAWSYALLKGRKVSRVVVIAPSHYEAFDFSAVYPGAAYATPLGQVPVDGAFAARLAKANPSIQLSEAGHGPREHALEVQLPFLQRVLGPFQLVPIVMGDQSYDASRELGVALAKLIQGTDTLIVASSDLSHYHPYDEAVRIDHKTLHALESWDYFNLSRNFGRRVWEACGGAPIVAAMIAAERLGANRAEVLQYANSGDTSGERSRVVGYGAVALLQEAGTEVREKQISLNRREEDELLEIGRKSVETAVREHKMSGPAEPKLSELLEDRGVFVTLTKQGRLRGCVGFVSPLKPLYLAVRDAAALAAVDDPRFPVVTANELGDLEYEISVLSPLHHLRDLREIRIGWDGLLVRNPDHEGVLLPQVASEAHWDRTTFVEQTCRKAGLPKNCWQAPETDVFRFTALVFGKQEPVEAILPVEPAVRSPQAPTPPGRSSPSPTGGPF